MHLGGPLAPFVGHQRVLETAVIQTNRFSRFFKQVDDWRASQTERLFVYHQIFARPPVEQKQNVHALRRRLWLEKIQERVGRGLPVRIDLVETQIEKEILLRKRK